MELKLSKALDRLGTESAFTILAEAKKLENKESFNGQRIP